MVIYYYYGVGPSFDILKQLDDEDAPVVRSKDGAWKVRARVEALASYALVSEEETVLVLCEVILRDEGVDVHELVVRFA